MTGSVTISPWSGRECCWPTWWRSHWIRWMFAEYVDFNRIQWLKTRIWKSTWNRDQPSEGKTCATCYWNNFDNVDISDYHHSIQLLHRQLHHHCGLFVMNIYRNVSTLSHFWTPDLHLPKHHSWECGLFNVQLTGYFPRFTSLVWTRQSFAWCVYQQTDRFDGWVHVFLMFSCYFWIELPYPNSCKLLQVGQKTSPDPNQ